MCVSTLPPFNPVLFSLGRHKLTLKSSSLIFTAFVVMTMFKAAFEALYSRASRPQYRDAGPSIYNAWQRGSTKESGEGLGKTAYTDSVGVQGLCVALRGCQASGYSQGPIGKYPHSLSRWPEFSSTALGVEESGRVRADVKLKWFNGSVREGRGRGFALEKGTASHKNMLLLRRVFWSELLTDINGDVMVGAAHKYKRHRRGHRLDGCSCSSR